MVIAYVISISLLASMIITPAYAARTIEVTKKVDVRKDLFEKTLTDLTSYKKIFPNLIKDVKIDQSNKNQAKFVIEAQGTREADIKSTVKPDGTFVVEILSGDLKGSKITTTLEETFGFDGTQNGGTMVKTELILETSFLASVVLSFVKDSEVQKGVGDGFYDLGQYIKVQYLQPNVQQVKVDYKEKDSKALKLEAAKKLDLQKEAKKIQSDIQTKPIKKEAVKPQPTIPKIKNVQKASELAKVETVKPTQKQSSFITLDPPSTTAKIGNVIIFSGKLHLLGTDPQGATVYIKDEDPFGGDDIMAFGIADSTGKFSIRWTVQNMDADSVADVYAVFEGSDIHPRLTTCGIDCTDTVQLATLR